MTLFAIDCRTGSSCRCFDLLSSPLEEMGRLATAFRGPIAIFERFGWSLVGIGEVKRGISKDMNEWGSRES